MTLFQEYFKPRNFIIFFLNSEFRHIECRTRADSFLKTSLLIDDIFKPLWLYKLERTEALLGVTMSCSRSDRSENLRSWSVNISSGFSSCWLRWKWTSLSSFESRRFSRQVYIRIISLEIDILLSCWALEKRKSLPII